MSAERRNEILERAFELEGGERARFVDAECGDDETLRAEVVSVLAVDAKGALPFLDEPPINSLPAPLQEPTAPIAPGERVGRYVVRRLIGRGGMSCVYEAEDSLIDRTVALKVLTASVDVPDTQRFLAEVRSLAKVKDDHVVQVHDCGEHNGAAYLVMELLEGCDLAASIAAGTLGGLRRKLDIARQIALAVHATHAAAIVHRDIKPANVFLVSGGRVKLLDFGIAQAMRNGTHRTLALIGTPEYLAPERLSGKADRASDVYSFGVLLFHLLAGREPFTGDLLQIISQVAFKALPLEPLREAKVPAPIIDLIGRLTDKQPAARPSMDAIINTLTNQIDALDRVGEPTASRPRWRQRAAAAALAGAVAVSAALVVTRGSTVEPQLREVAAAAATTEPSPTAEQTIKLPAQTPQAPRSPEPAVVTATQVPATRTPVAVIPAERVRQDGSASAGAPDPVDVTSESASPPSVLPEDSARRTAPSPVVETRPPSVPAPVPARTSPDPPARASVVSEPSATGRDLASRAAVVNEEQHELEETLRRLAQALNSRQASAVQSVWPTLTGDQRRQIAESFSTFKAVQVTFIPQGSATVTRSSDGRADTATLRVARSVRMTPRSGDAPPPVNEVVELSFERRAAGWVVTNIH
jgi:hypothetical protein